MSNFVREELRGVSRGKDAKDIDWEKVAGLEEDSEEEVVEKPAPIKIPASEVINRVRKPAKKYPIKSSGTTDKNSENSFYFVRFLF